MKTYYHTLSQALLFSDEHHQLKKALTHSSFYSKETKDECSKYIFLGMYAFKGKVADILNSYVPISGKQLQQYLGNLFKDSQLEIIYERYHLRRCIRHGRDFPVEKHHKLFVYALLGFVYAYAEEKYLNRFIYRNFLEGTDYLRPKHFVSKDLWAQCIYLVKMQYNEKIVINESTNKNGVYVCSICSDNEVYVSVESRSQQYAKRKCIKLLLRKVRNDLKEDWLSNPLNVAVERELQKKKAEALAKEKAQKLKEYKEKHRKRAEEIAEKKNIRKQELRLRDEARRIAKAKAKKRREEMEELRRKQKLALANMSASKRRHLQDKGQLQKGVPPSK